MSEIKVQKSCRSRVKGSVISLCKKGRATEHLFLFINVLQINRQCTTWASVIKIYASLFQTKALAKPFYLNAYWCMFSHSSQEFCLPLIRIPFFICPNSTVWKIFYRKRKNEYVTWKFIILMYVNECKNTIIRLFQNKVC